MTRKTKPSRPNGTTTTWTQAPSPGRHRSTSLPIRCRLPPTTRAKKKTASSLPTSTAPCNCNSRSVAITRKKTLTSPARSSAAIWRCGTARRGRKNSLTTCGATTPEATSSPPSSTSKTTRSSSPTTARPPTAGRLSGATARSLTSTARRWALSAAMTRCKTSRRLTPPPASRTLS